jgi:monoterpene epsilon-lactone hydrolase
MVSLAARAIKAYARLVIRHHPRDEAHLVRHIRRSLNNAPLPVILPLGVRRATFAANGVHGDLLKAGKPTQAVLYLHGGGYVAGVTRTYMPLCGKLAKALKADVYMPDYRLAPEHPFPAALDDAMATYMLMLKQFPASRITIMGDSAGGGLTLGLLLAIRDRGLPLPKCAAVYSPYTDLTSTADSRIYNDGKDDMFTRSMFTVGVSMYGRTEADRINPHGSPCRGDFQGIPPLFITVSEEELLRDDAYMVAERARLAGVDVELVSRKGLLHVWPIFYPVMPEARLDVKKTIRFIQQF